MILRKEDYDYICKSCDYLLNKSTNHFRIGNDWLHVIRPHPIYFRQYEHIFNIGSNLNFYFFLIRKLLLYTLLICLRLAKSLKGGNVNLSYKSQLNINSIRSEYHQMKYQLESMDNHNWLCVSQSFQILNMRYTL